MIPPIDALPTELFVDILQHVIDGSSAYTLATCVLVCQRWKQIATPILHRHVVLTYSNISLYSPKDNKSNAQHTRSLTIRIHPSQTLEEYERVCIAHDAAHNATERVLQLWERLQVPVSRILGQFNKLHTFTFVVSDAPPPSSTLRTWFRVPGPTIAGLVDILPDSCVNIVITTTGLDTSTPGFIHLCHSIGRRFSRLKSLYLHIGNVCSAIFGRSTVHRSLKSATNRFANAPLLQSLVLDCTNDWFSNALECRVSENTAIQAHETLNSTLRLMVSQSCFPSAKRIILYDLTNPHDPEDCLLYQTLNKRDFVQNTTLCTPVMAALCKSKQKCFLARPMKGLDIISNRNTIVDIVENAPLHQTTSQERLALVVFDIARRGSPDYTPEEAHILNRASAELRDEMMIAPQIWKNERECDMRLVDAEYREGTTTRVCLKEKTPSGWMRGSQGTLIRVHAIHTLTL
jgi:hypothetical protein